MTDDTMSELLAAIRTILANDCTIEFLGERGGFVQWALTCDDTYARVLIEPDLNGHPQFWCECPSSISAQYLAPIYAKLGDARDKAVARRLSGVPQPSGV